MPELEPHGKYISVAGNRVYMRGAIEDVAHVRFYYGDAIMKILGKENTSFEELCEIMKNQHVLSGLTSDSNMPGGCWHQETGKCLVLNAGGLKGEKYENALRNFSIEKI